ncbi:MAG: type VI secretion system baseplate subunit TssF, partial [Zoogloea sp.]|nr:type VI secretion system baseplate subunit TssF [Zoogloea sp.]
MKDLLPYYERELAFLRSHSREFAERYPKLAAQLLLSGEGCDDPHVERMIESFALMTARVSKKIEDSYPQFTEALLSVLYPHYLRPFPSCSIAHFEQAGSALSSVSMLPRGSELQSRPI